MKRSNEVLQELWSRLRPMRVNWKPSTQEDVFDTIQNWFNDHFEEMSLSCGISQMAIDHAGAGITDLKAHVARNAAMKMGVELCAKYAIGEEKHTPDYYQRYTGLSADNRPAFMTHEYNTEMRMTIVAMKRQPSAWFRQESADAWLKRISSR